MEKRTILAFALAFMILIGWSFFFTPKSELPQKNMEQPKEEEAQLPSTSVETPIYEPSTALNSGLIEGEAETPPVEIFETTVETPLYRAVFTNRGPAVISFKLLNYNETIEQNSKPVELVNLNEPHKEFMQFNFNNQRRAGKREFIFNADEKLIKVDKESSYRELTFSCPDVDGMTIKQTFRFYPDKYNIDLKITVENRSEYQASGNIEARIQGMPPSKKVKYYSFAGIALLMDNELEEIAPKKMKDEKTLSGNIDWLAWENEYFLSAIVPLDSEKGYFKGQVQPTGLIRGEYISPLRDLKPLEAFSSDFTLFMGPRDIEILKSAGNKLEKAIDFGFFDIIAKPLHFVLRFFNGFVHNYGLSIIILTVLIKILFWPLTQKSHRSMKEMQKIQPLMAKIREKYRDNKEQMNKEMMNLYRTYKVNPMGGCLPMLIQIPVFFALYRILGNSIELRHAPFMLWINDLSAPDRLFNFSFSLPFMSPPYGIPVLTLLMGASMFIQQKMQPMVGDPAQAKVMMFLPVIFTVMFINFPSGLVLYWLTQNILTIGQQYLIRRK